MARPGITQEQVNHAADSLVAAGKNATIDAVRDALGTGSKGTIHKMLGVWKAAAPAVAKVAREIPAPLSAALANEIDRASAEARAEIEGKLADLQKEADGLASDVERLESERDTLADQVAILTQERESLSGLSDEQGKEIERLQADLDRERGAAEAARVEMAKAQIRVEDQATKLAEQSAELANFKAAIDTTQKARAVAEQDAAVLVAKLEAADASKTDLVKQIETIKADTTKQIERLQADFAKQLAGAEARAQAARQAADEARAAAEKAGREAAELKGELTAMKAAKGGK